MKYILLLILMIPACSLGQNVTFLANEGFLIKVGDKTVVIDGFFGPYFKEYSVLNEENLEMVKKAKAPFDKVDLILSSHIHEDHFNDEVVSRHLKSNPNAAFFSNEEVTAKLRLKFSDINKQIYSENAVFGHVYKKTINGVNFSYLRMKHVGRKTFKGPENYVYIIHGEKQIVQTGDAELDEENLAPYKDIFSKTDILLFPFWYAVDSEKMKLIEAYFPKAKYILSHLHKDYRKSIKSFLRSKNPDRFQLAEKAFQVF